MISCVLKLNTEQLVVLQAIADDTLPPNEELTIFQRTVVQLLWGTGLTRCTCCAGDHYGHRQELTPLGAQVLRGPQLTLRGPDRRKTDEYHRAG